ncbi:MAG: TetR/AcrR family transcriptional regulator [Actinomycetota bacterium]|nr:TetR/AcrR family transcriptional regulator [Actinomycetota bacterium]MDA3019754.1 TetR/AcrR family transcriptional regulator [Actinomycetota bacterium]
MTKGMENTDSAIRLRLIDSTLFMIDRDGVDGARLKDIVEHADMTTGSLYWFFKNRRALINAALAERYVRKMRTLTDLVTEAFSHSADFNDPLLIMNEITVQPNLPDRVDARAERVQVLAAALEDPVLAKHVADIQRQLLNQISDIVKGAQIQKFIRADVNPYAVAVMMQSTAIGLASVDLARDLMPDVKAWSHLMNIVVSSLKP